MIGLLVGSGLAAAAFCMLREGDYLTWNEWPDGLGWAVQLVNGKQTWGIRVEYHNHELTPWVGRCWRWEPAAPWLNWPRCLRVSVKKFKIFIYLGTASQNLGHTGKKTNNEDTNA